MPKDNFEANDMTRTELATILLDEWKFRQQHCWRSIQRYGFSAIAVSIVPYIQTEMFEQLGRAILLFPAVSGLLAIAAVWLFGAEYIRLNYVVQQYRNVLHETGFVSPYVLTGWKKAIFGQHIGWVTVVVSFLGFAFLIVVNWYLIWNRYVATVGDVAN